MINRPKNSADLAWVPPSPSVNEKAHKARSSLNLTVNPKVSKPYILAFSPNGNWLMRKGAMKKRETCILNPKLSTEIAETQSLELSGFVPGVVGAQ